RVLYFAGDPFSEAPVAEAALLLDNAIGVLTGERASSRARYSIDGELPSSRAAHAGPFEPRGALAESRTDAPREFAPWMLAIAALCALAASIVSIAAKARK